MEVRQTFAVGQTVTVLTDDGFLFVGTIICCDSKFKCDICDDRLTIKENWHDKDKEKEKEKDHKDKDCKEKDHKKDNDHDCDRFLVLQLEEDVEVGGPPGPSVVAFEEGDTVFINFCQIIAIAQGFPPDKKKSD